MRRRERPGADRGGGGHGGGLLFALLGLVAILAWPVSAAGGAEASPDPGVAASELAPDIIVVMTDDLGYMSDERVLKRLPNIRELWLEGGVRFTRMYDETPLCCPSRANFLTGLHTWHHGVIKNNGNPLDVSQTIAVALHDAGYHTLMAGNYLNKVRGTPMPPGWDHTLIKRRSEPPSFWRNGKLVSFRRAFVDDVTRRMAVRWTRTAPTDQPLFGWFAPVAPHVCEYQKKQCYLPLVDPRDSGADECRGLRPLRPPTYTTVTNPYEARPMPHWPAGWKMRPICESLLVVDRMVGEIVSAQAERGRPAIFVFMSDNGMSWGQKGFTFKKTPPAVRLPFYVAGTGLAPAETDALLSIIDVAPTFADLASVELPGVDGTNFAPLLRGEPFAGREELLEVMPRSDEDRYPGFDGLRTPQWHYIRWLTGRRELYDVQADPWEQANLVEQDPERAAAMEARLDELIVASGGDPSVIPE